MGSDQIECLLSPPHPRVRRMVRDPNKSFHMHVMLLFCARTLGTPTTMHPKLLSRGY